MNEPAELQAPQAMHTAMKPTCPGSVRLEEPSRRHLMRAAIGLLGGLIGIVLTIPGLGYVLSPLLRGRSAAGGFVPLARFQDLPVGVPRSFPVVESRRDAWVKYPEEPVGMVWLVRQPEGSATPVIAFSAECPHLACAINLSPDAKEFFCPCHTSSFSLDGQRLNKVSPRGMDRLEVETLDPAAPDAVVRVKFERFRTMTEEQVPLA